MCLGTVLARHQGLRGRIIWKGTEWLHLPHQNDEQMGRVSQESLTGTPGSSLAIRSQFFFFCFDFFCCFEKLCWGLLYQTGLP